MRKTFIIILLFASIAAKAQEKENTDAKNIYSFELTTGINDLMYLSYYNDENAAIGNRKYLTLNNEINLNYFKAKVLFNFDEKWNFAIGYSMQKIRHDDNNVKNFSQLKFGLNYYPYNFTNNKIGFSFDVGIHSIENEPSFGFGAYWLHKLSPRFDLVVNPVLDFNYWKKDYINTNIYYTGFDRKLKSTILSLNVGIRFNPLKKTNTEEEYYDEIENPGKYYQQKDKSLGFSFGMNFLSLRKERFFTDLDAPQYRNAFYYRTALYPSLDLVYKTKNNSIHSIELVYRNYNDYEKGVFGEFDMAIAIKDYIFAYKYEVPMSKKGFKNKESNPLIPYVGLKFMYDHKTFSIKDIEFNSMLAQNYNLDINNTSDLFLLQISPSIKKLLNHFYWDLAMNINIAGLASGTYKYYYITKGGGLILPAVKDNINTDYNKFLTPKDLFTDWFFVHNISFKLGYMF